MSITSRTIVCADREECNIMQLQWLLGFGGFISSTGNQPAGKTADYYTLVNQPNIDFATVYEQTTGLHNKILCKLLGWVREVSQRQTSLDL